ncbi:MAG: MFS transporter [Ferrovum sp. 37-45-19]|nr:MAG: MFS transporter [Ferrovum sp. 21-44-67]OYV94374.1 MAG: MFS transporter [Ferrovum sp. 37-45-19]OZB33248.1 MAG: MFS transporter [Ferrovum sp. 34-44-207]HQT80634.1 OFA family MFS transporter [Ferrovaceae bacterium]HQU06739.1 OFA family MFS transporter [Ferrovaceae bacterium]
MTWSALNRENTIAGPKFNRWLVPPAALAIHLCIGMSYGFSVFWKPMVNLLPNADALACKNLSTWDMLFTTTCNWTIPMVTPIFELFIAVLGIAAFIWGGWLEHAGPRKAGFIAAITWGGGLVLGGIGVINHQLWLLWLSGIVGGIGQGLGYISPVSTLIKWFPDRRGLATGFAIMGYGGGAMIGAPLAVALMKHYAAIPGINNVGLTLITMGILYFIIMSLGAFGFRIAPTGWKPLGWTPKDDGGKKYMITQNHVHLDKAWKTPQFWLVWGVLCLNVTAGIGVISMASPMLQDVFGPHLLGLDISFDAVSPAQKAAIAASAAGLVGLISLFNSLGRLFWASMSDFLGRKSTYAVFFILGIALYIAMPSMGHHGSAGLFIVAVCVVLSMYGGGFSTVPAYLADLFGTQMVGAIHGRLLTAWSVAGIVGPTLIASLRQAQIDAGVPHNLVYDRTLYILAVLLLAGMVCNLLVRPVDPKYHMTEEELKAERSKAHEQTAGKVAVEDTARGSLGLGGVIAWAAVGIPFLIGVFIAIQKAAKLF